MKSFYPKVGDKFYYKAQNGEIVERICKHIEERKGIEIMFFTSWDEGGGCFVNESSILNPNSKKVKNFLEEKEKKAWREFWTKERKQEFVDFCYNKVRVETTTSVGYLLNSFINDKTK